MGEEQKLTLKEIKAMTPEEQKSRWSEVVEFLRNQQPEPAKKRRYH